MSDEKKPKLIPKRIPVEWEQDSDKIITRYATNFAIQHTENEFFLTFYEIRPPFALGNEEEVKKQYQSLDKIKAECVARIAISANELPAIIEACKTNLETYRKKQELLEVENGE